MSKEKIDHKKLETDLDKLLNLSKKDIKVPISMRIDADVLEAIKILADKNNDKITSTINKVLRSIVIENPQESITSVTIKKIWKEFKKSELRSFVKEEVDSYLSSSQPSKKKTKVTKKRA